MKTYTCILCPNGCVIDETFSGALCAKGKEYVRQELTDPRRTISSLVKVTGGARPLVGVRLTKPIPKARIMDAMAAIRGMTLSAPVSAGQVLVKDILGFDCDLVAIDGM